MTPFQFRSARKLFKLTQAQWAGELGYDAAYSADVMSRYENGKSRIPKTTAKLVALMVERELEKMRKTLVGKG